ncbi:hypothetical protein F7642_12810 [Tenacibaculum finnmarkense genomovar ulcerans]|uniref:hypothetical protein n=1 Tax=Tenacibaculum finnmarkense TaxID=2781243 RepID=UPI00187B342E|nr:hypothetical protein [Tenacibaculum finnmarkense]MBE7635200.1 hypothetical protein [Tenacibaculum finnmarkense genomovar ulcerans]MCD8431149.1 hypothetical protein [Tenacibaculum finnmarkense genomovar ulcerans]
MKIIDIILISGIPTTLGALFTLYITERVKGNVKNRFDKKLEIIKKENNLEITKFQTELTLLKDKENFKFTKLHEKRFKILERIYILLNQAMSELNVYVHPLKFVPNNTNSENNENKLHENYINAHNEFLKYFNDNRIYLNENIKKLIKNYLVESNTIYNDYYKKQFLNTHGTKLDSESEISAMTAYKKVPKIIEPIIENIEKEFIRILEK